MGRTNLRALPWVDGGHFIGTIYVDGVCSDQRNQEALTYRYFATAAPFGLCKYELEVQALWFSQGAPPRSLIGGRRWGLRVASNMDPILSARPKTEPAWSGFRQPGSSEPAIPF